MMLRREKKFLTYTFLRWSLLVLEEAQAGIKIAGRMGLELDRKC